MPLNKGTGHQRAEFSAVRALIELISGRLSDPSETVAGQSRMLVNRHPLTLLDL